MAIDKGVWTWTGFSGAPGYSIFYATPDVGLSGVINTFWGTVAEYLPTAVTIAGPTTGDRLDETTGTLTGTWTGGAGGTEPGRGAGAFAAPAGVSVTWLTAGVKNGRRVRGRTFIVPIIASAYANDGSLETTAHAELQAAADALVAAAAGDLKVWSRPVGGVGGSAYPVTGARVADRVSILRSRRD